MFCVNNMTTICFYLMDFFICWPPVISSSRKPIIGFLWPLWAPYAWNYVGKNFSTPCELCQLNRWPNNFHFFIRITMFIFWVSICNENYIIYAVNLLKCELFTMPIIPQFPQTPEL